VGIPRRGRKMGDNRCRRSRVKEKEIQNQVRSNIRGCTHSLGQVSTRPLGQYPLWCIACGTQPSAKRGVILCWRS